MDIHIPEHEDQKTEIKEYSGLFLSGIYITICAFSNSDGGKIFIKIKDKDSATIKKYIQTIETNLNKYIKALQKDNISIQHNDNIICIEVRPSETVVYYIPNDSIYIRIGDLNHKAESEAEAYYIKKTLSNQFPQYSKNEPSEKDKRNEFNNILKDNNLSFETIGLQPKGNFLYKYMDLESALISLENANNESSLRFVEPSCWEDQYESRFYNAIYDNKKDDADAPLLYSCCFTSKRENEAAWVLYSHNRTGLASRCVEFTINKSRLRYQLAKNLENSKLYMGIVQYKPKEYIDNLHKPYIGEDNHENAVYHQYFDHFSLQVYLYLLLHKRPVFEHEREVRYFIIPNDQNKEKYNSNHNAKNKKDYAKFVKIDWIDIIDGIKIDKSCTDYEYNLLQKCVYALLEKKKDEFESEDKYNKTKQKLMLQKFDPYADETSKNGPLKIKTGRSR